MYCLSLSIHRQGASGAAATAAAATSSPVQAAAALATTLAAASLEGGFGRDEQARIPLPFEGNCEVRFSLSPLFLFSNQGLFCLAGLTFCLNLRNSLHLLQYTLPNDAIQLPAHNPVHELGLVDENAAKIEGDSEVSHYGVVSQLETP